jgi:hypothetical protein
VTGSRVVVLLALVLVTVGGCDRHPVPPHLVGPVWVRSNEEDTIQQEVLRPESFPFPPSRGRLKYEFRAGGRLVVRGPGPSEAEAVQEGRWSFREPAHLVLVFDSAPERDVACDIVQVTSDVLILRVPWTR